MVKLNRIPGFWYDGIVLARVAVGVMLIVDGWQLFEDQDMTVVATLLFDMSMPFSQAMAYTGKLVELAGGLFLIIGLFTRVMTALLFITFMIIAFSLGEGKVFSDNQLPFLYGIICLTFFFTGAGRISMDFILFTNRNEDSRNDISTKGFGRYVSRS